MARYRADSQLAPSQWETSLQSNAVSHWLCANLESALRILYTFGGVAQTAFTGNISMFVPGHSNGPCPRTIEPLYHPDILRSYGWHNSHISNSQHLEGYFDRKMYWISDKVPERFMIHWWNGYKWGINIDGISFNWASHVQQSFRHGSQGHSIG